MELFYNPKIPLMNVIDAQIYLNSFLVYTYGYVI